MPTPGRPVLSSTGRPAVRSGGRALVFDSAGECAECCGGGPPNPGSSCCNPSGVNCGYVPIAPGSNLYDIFVSLSWSISVVEAATWLDTTGADTLFIPTSASSTGNAMQKKKKKTNQPPECLVSREVSQDVTGQHGEPWRVTAFGGVGLGIISSFFETDTEPPDLNNQITNLDRPSRTINNAAETFVRLGLLTNLPSDYNLGGSGTPADPYIVPNQVGFAGASGTREVRTGWWDIQVAVDSLLQTGGDEISAKSGTMSGPINTCPTVVTMNFAYRYIRRTLPGLEERNDTTVTGSITAQFSPVASCGTGGNAAGDCGCGCGGSCG